MTDTRAPMLAGLASAHPELFTLANALENHGIRVHLVGGPVRDTLSGLVPNDLDVTSAATPTEFRSAVNAANAAGELDGYHVSIYDIGEDHGTTGVAIGDTDGNHSVIEHTTHRREVYTNDSRTPEVSFGTDLTEDLARRDFTVNAIAIDLITGELCDPYGGADDIADGVLRCCDTPEVTFSEDPLRIARLVRFAAQRGYRIDDATGHAAAVVADRLDIVSAERIRDEMTKMARDGVSLAAAIRVAAQLGVEMRIFDIENIDAIDLEALEANTCTHPAYGTCVLAAASGDAEGWARRWRHDRSTIALTRSVERAIRTVEAGGPAAVEIRRLGTPEKADLATAVAATTRSEAATSLAEAAAAADVLCAPLTVTGSDALEAGLNGPAIGEALKELNRRHALRGGLDRATALAELAELAAAS